MVQDRFTKEWEYRNSKYMDLRGLLALSEESILIAECYVSKDRINIIDTTIIEYEEDVSSNQKDHKTSNIFLCPNESEQEENWRIAYPKNEGDIIVRRDFREVTTPDSTIRNRML